MKVAPADACDPSVVLVVTVVVEISSFYVSFRSLASMFQ